MGFHLGKSRRSDASPAPSEDTAGSSSSRASIGRSGLLKKLPGTLLPRRRRTPSLATSTPSTDGPRIIPSPDIPTSSLTTGESRIVPSPPLPIEPEPVQNVTLDIPVVSSIETRSGSSHSKAVPVSLPTASPPSPSRLASSKLEAPITANTAEPHLVPLFRRLRPPGQPFASEANIPNPAGTVVTDGFIAYKIPDDWQATRVDSGFRLTGGGCIGYICAVAAEDASLALCDTSRLAVLDSFDVGASPVVDQHADVFVMVVEYRNHGAGRGVALVERNETGGAVVFMLSGPSSSHVFLSETEQQLLSTAFVVRVPEKKSAGGPATDSTAELPAPWETSKESACVVM